MSSGRKPKPMEVHKANGNPSKKSLKELEGVRIPKPESAAPPCPKFLTGDAKKEWSFITKELQKMDLLGRSDKAILAQYCQWYGRWVEAETKAADAPMLVKSKANTPMTNPYIKIAKVASDQVRKCLVELGLTPSARVRLGGMGQTGEGEDPFEELERKREARQRERAKKVKALKKD